MNSSPPRYWLPAYGLDRSQLEVVETLQRLPLWERRKHHKLMTGGPQKAFIYRYMPFNVDDNFCLKKARDLLVESKLFLSAPSGFNDPYDFRAFVTFEEDPASRRRYFEKSARALLARGIDPVPEIRGTRRKVEALVGKAMAKSIVAPSEANAAFERARDLNGVACFSEDPRGLLLWSHYAAGHTGICLQFDVTQDPGMLLLGHSVRYRDELAQLVWPRDKGDVVEKVILSKGRIWETEREVRYVSLHVINDSLQFDSRALTGVILGSRFPASSLPALDEIIQDRKKNGFSKPILYQAFARDREYGIFLGRHRD